MMKQAQRYYGCVMAVRWISLTSSELECKDKVRQ